MYQKHKVEDTRCCKGGRSVRGKGRQLRSGAWWFAAAAPVWGLIALAWFLIRVIPKPSRAAYPCQRVALPVAGTYLLWLVGVIGSALAFRGGRQLNRRSRYGWGALCTLVAVAVAGACWFRQPSVPVVADTMVPNVPVGVARGIHPGRVVWVHDANATEWEGTNYEGEDIGDGYWFEPSHTEQAATDTMMSRAVQALTGETSDSAAWSALFTHSNQQRGKGSVGYVSGEKVCIKANLVTAHPLIYSVDPDLEQTRRLGWINTSPQMIVALLDQLVNVVGVAEADITVGDTTTDFPNHYWDYCQSRFPGVHYLDRQGILGRRLATSSEQTAAETRVYWSTVDAAGYVPDFLPISYAEAEYGINFACLKGHSSGITVCAKNHYGSLIRLPSSTLHYNLHLSLPNGIWSPGMGHYRSIVDLMGHEALGKRTVLYLIDGLYGGYESESRPYLWSLPPFESDWPSSLFAAQDPVAIDSVAYDFLLAEWPHVVADPELQGGAEDYLHEAAQADNPPSGTFYDPNGTGTGLTSLGVHEHWDSPATKQYSRNLGTGVGIELVAIDLVPDGDADGDGFVDDSDYIAFSDCLSGPGQAPLGTHDPASYACKAAFNFDTDADVDLADFAELQRRMHR